MLAPIYLSNMIMKHLRPMCKKTPDGLNQHANSISDCRQCLYKSRNTAVTHATMVHKAALPNFVSNPLVMEKKVSKTCFKQPFRFLYSLWIIKQHQIQEYSSVSATNALVYVTAAALGMIKSLILTGILCKAMEKGLEHLSVQKKKSLMACKCSCRPKQMH